MQIDPEQLRDAMLGLLARPQPRTPDEPSEPYKVDPKNLEFDWDVLRLMVNAKVRRDLKGPRGQGFRELSRIVGVSDTALGGFLHGQPGIPTVRTTIRLMAWLGYSDLKEFVVREDD